MRGTTPTITIALPDEVSVSMIEAAVFSMSQNETEIIKKKLDEIEVDTEENSCYVTLTQEESLSLNETMLVDMQLKFRIGDKVYKTEIVKEPAGKVLNKEVI